MSKPKHYTNEIPYDDLQFIISDLYRLLDEKTKAEEYENCAALQDVISGFEQYGRGELDYIFVMSDLFTLCCNRYTVYSINYVGIRRFVTFVLPNCHFMFFYVHHDPESSRMFEVAECAYENNKNLIQTCIDQTLEFEKQNSKQ